MKKINFIIFLFFLFGFFQLILVYKNFQLMNRITNLEDKKNLIMVKIKKETIHLDSLSTLSYSFLKESLTIKPLNFSEKDSFTSLISTQIAEKENGQE